MSFDAGSRRATEVQTGIRPVRFEGAVEYVERLVEQLPDFGPLVGIQLAGGGEVPVRRDQDMPIRVWVKVENHEARRPAVQNQGRLVVRLLWGCTEDALQGIVSRRRLHELQTPWCP